MTTKQTKKTTRKNTGKSNMNIWDKLRYIQQNLEAPKNQYNKFGDYYYRSCEDILEGVKPLLDETVSCLTITDDIVEVGGRIYVKATVSLFEPKQDGNSIKVSAYAREQETKPKMDTSQVTGSASSYARKYALNGLFAINDVNDPDDMDNRNNKNNKPKTATKPQQKNDVEVGVEQKKVLNYIIESLATKVEDNHIINVKKLTEAILEKYGKYPSENKYGDVVIKYIIDDLGIDKVSVENDFLKDIDE